MFTPGSYLYVLTFADVLSARFTSSQRIFDRYNSGEHFHKNHSRSLSREQVGFFFSSASFIIFRGTKKEGSKAPHSPF